MLKLGAYVVDRRPLSVPAFRRLWVASAVSAIGGSFSLVAVPAQLFTLTGSSAFVGLSAAVSMCALVGSALWAGVLADSMDRRRLLWPATPFSLRPISASGSTPGSLACLSCWCWSAPIAVALLTRAVPQLWHYDVDRVSYRVVEVGDIASRPLCSRRPGDGR